MNLKDKLIELRNKLIKKDEIKESIDEEEKINQKEFIKFLEKYDIKQ